MTETAQYVYAVGEATALTEPAGSTLTGIDGAAVTCTVADRLCALTSAVSVPAFQAAQQAHDVSETGWLAGAVRAHERVILQALAGSSVLPMRFGTVYSTSADVHAMLRLHQTALLAELRRLAGGTEWCLTVRTDDSATADDGAVDSPTADNGAADSAASGTAWLLSRQAALRERASRTDRVAELLDRLRGSLAPHVRETVVSRTAGTGSARLWLLVDDVARLRDAVAELSERGYPQLELTGPWPVYHFVRTDTLHDSTDAQHDNSTGTLHDADPAEAPR